MGLRFFFLIGLVLLVSDCTQGHCRRKADEPAAAVPVTAVPDVATKSVVQDHVFVYKYDGSLQCGQGKGVSTETMAKELNGIAILSMTKKSDGLMHIQVCGSNTGMANVYEISGTSQKKAESKGFKKWTFEP